MDSKDLEQIIDFLGENLRGKGFSLKTRKNLFFEIVYKKESLFNKFKDEVSSKWMQFIKENKARIIENTYLFFLYENFDYFFSKFIYFFFGLNSQKELTLNNKDKLSGTTLLFRYHYSLSKDEEEIFRRGSELYNNHNDELVFPTAYLYFIVNTFGIILTKLMRKKFVITLEGAIYKENGNYKYTNFLILVKDSRDELYSFYYKMILYYFYKQFKGIPEQYYEKLLTGRQKLYNLALTQYSEKQVKEKLVDLLYYFYQKCRILENCCPILDFLNFVCSRVEDSVFSKINVINKEYLSNFDYNSEKKNSLIKIFKYLDQKSTLSSTFLANNLPSDKSQLNLFLLYKKYYFGNGLETLEIGDILFLPTLFRTKLNEYNKSLDHVINSNTIKNINNFLNYFSVISNTEHINLFIKKIFHEDLSELNYEFFKTFFKSLNEKLFQLIKEENKNFSYSNSENTFNFEFVMDHICRILYVLIDKIFLRETPMEASENFIDPRGRYIARNIALRVLELFIFQDLNFSDDLWPDFLISYNKEKIVKKLNKFEVPISEKKFYNNEELTRFLITYNFQSFSQELNLEEWLIKRIIIPLNNFLLYIKDSVKDPNNNIEVYEKISEFFTEHTDNKDIVNEIKDVSQRLASFWECLEV